MFPSPQRISVARRSTLREFMAGLDPDVLYAYERRVIVVTVNGKPIWPSAPLKPGDEVSIIPIITGG